MTIDKLREANQLESYIRECERAKESLDKNDLYGFLKIVTYMELGLPEIKEINEVLKVAIDKKIEERQKEFDAL